MNKGLLKSSRFFAGFFIGVISLVFFSATASHAAPTLDGITIQCNGDDSLNQTLNGGTIRFVLEMSHEITGVNIAGGTPYILLSRIKNLATGTDSSADEFRAYYAGAAQDGTELYFDYPIKAGDFSAGVDVKGTLELDGCVIHTSGGDVPSTIELMDASPYTECGYRIQISTFYFGSSGVQLKEVTVPEKKAKKGLTYYATIYSGALTTSDVPFDISVDYDGYEDIDFAVENQYGVGGTVNSLYGDTVSTYLSMTGGVMRLAITPKNVLYDEEIKIRIRPAGAGGDTSGDMFVVYPNGIEEDKAYIERIYVDSSADNRIYSCGEIIQINVDFCKTISSVSGIPLLYLNVNNQNNNPNYSNNNQLRNYAVYNESRSSGNTVVFEYTVKAGDYIDDLDAMYLKFNTSSGKFEFSDGSQFDWIVPHGDDIEGLASNSNISIQTIVFYDYCSTTASPEVREDYTLDLRVTRGAAVAGYAQHFTLSSDKSNGDKIEYPTTFAIPAGAMDAVIPIKGVDVGTQTLRLHPYGYDDASGDLVATIEVKKGDNDPSVRLSSAQNSFSEGSDPFTMTLGLSRQPKENIRVTVYADKPECVRIVGGAQTSAGNVFTFPKGSSTTFDISVTPLDGPQTVTIYAVATNASYATGYKFTTANSPIQISNSPPDADVTPLNDNGEWVIYDFWAMCEEYVLWQVLDSAADLKAGIRYSITWGDGSMDSGICDASGYGYASHTYARANGNPEEGYGGYAIRLTLTDKDGGSSTMSGRIIVNSPATVRLREYKRPKGNTGGFSYVSAATGQTLPGLGKGSVVDIWGSGRRVIHEYYDWESYYFPNSGAVVFYGQPADFDDVHLATGETATLNSFFHVWQGDCFENAAATNPTLHRATSVIVINDEVLYFTIGGVFSREYYPEDNCPDIDFDMLPDVWEESFWPGKFAFEHVGGSADSPYGRNDNTDGDYLPVCVVGINADGSFAVSGNDYSANGLPFSNVFEVRGTHWGLNASMSDAVELQDEPHRGTYAEDGTFTDTDSRSFYGTDPTLADTDGLPDGWEYFFWRTAMFADAPMGERLLPDSGSTEAISNSEIVSMFNPCVPGTHMSIDIDGDGLTNYEEFMRGTNPIVWDTDGDGFVDGYYEPVQTVTLDAAGGTVEPQSVIRDYGDVYGALPTPRRKGFSFKAWTLNGIAIFPLTVVSSAFSHTLTATWLPSAIPTIEELLAAAIDNAGFADTEGVKAAIGGDFAKYAEFRAWAQGVPGGEEAVVDSSFAAKSYLLGASALMTKEIESEDVRIVSFETGGAQLPATSGEAATLCFTLEVEIDGVDIGGGAVDEDVLKENLKKVLGIEGARTLAPDSFSSDNIDITFGTPVDGKARIIVSPPPDAGSTFFMRVKVK